MGTQLTQLPPRFSGHVISAVSGPKFAILWVHVEDVSLFNKVFAIVDKCLIMSASATQDGHKMSCDWQAS